MSTIVGFTSTFTSTILLLFVLHSSVYLSLSETSECQGANCPPEGGQTAGASRTFFSSLALILAVVLSVL